MNSYHVVWDTFVTGTEIGIPFNLRFFVDEKMAAVVTLTVAK
jgi:hypothetical protein